jgi:hypothetical protein
MGKYTKFYKRVAMGFTTILMFSLIATSQTNVTVRVSDERDDVEELDVWYIQFTLNCCRIKFR